MASSYVVAIPTYNRIDEVIKKTLNTLKEGCVNKNKIYLFVANKAQYELYEKSVPKNLYNKIIIGKKGITNQRNFISNYFNEGQYVISMDDDVERIEILKGERLTPLKDLNVFFINAYKILKQRHLFIWGIYPVRHSLFMYNDVTFDLRFIIGVIFGFITRHNNNLKMSTKSETKEDYEQTILYYLEDGGVVRFNNITVKNKYKAEGGLGTDRYDRNKIAAEYLIKKYPDIVSKKERKSGTPEVKLSRLPYLPK